MTQKEARKIMLWKAIERYRTAGGREEHHTYKELLGNCIDDMLDIGERANADAEWDIRGELAAALKCWHRLTGEEAAELVAFVAALKAPLRHNAGAAPRSEA